MKYLVAKVVGGVFEKPKLSYSELQLIDAYSSNNAIDKYRKENKCYDESIYCIGEYDMLKDEIVITNAFKRIELLNITK